MTTSTPSADPGPGPFLGLRTAIYPAPDLAAAKAWMTSLLGFEPYFDADFYVGYEVGGYELALDPHGDPARGVVTYWGVADADAAYAHLVATGATPEGEVQEVGGGIRTATFVLPVGGAVLGIIENPGFALPDLPVAGGPGR